MKTITRILTALLMLALVVSCCCKGGKKTARNPATDHRGGKPGSIQDL